MGNKRKILILLVLLALIGLAVAFRGHLRVESLLAQMRALGPWRPLAFILLYGIATPLFVPGLPLTLAGGALFGPACGTLYSLVGATGGATLAFFIARPLASDWMERRTKGIAKRLKEGMEHEGWRFVAFTRLVPQPGHHLARRWERGGVWRTTLKMWVFRLLRLAGVSPMRLKRFYGDAR